MPILHQNFIYNNCTDKIKLLKLNKYIFIYELTHQNSIKVRIKNKFVLLISKQCFKKRECITQQVSYIFYRGAPRCYTLLHARKIIE
jgi:hypothetical protein